MSMERLWEWLCKSNPGFQDFSAALQWFQIWYAAYSRSNRLHKDLLNDRIHFSCEKNRKQLLPAAIKWSWRRMLQLDTYLSVINVFLLYFQLTLARVCAHLFGVSHQPKASSSGSKVNKSLLFKCVGHAFQPNYFQSYANTSYGLFTRWMREINQPDLGQFLPPKSCFL